MAQATTPLSIRRMYDHDVPIVHAIETTAHIDPWSEKLIRDCVRVGYECWVLSELNTIIGFAIMSNTPDECHLFNLCIHPSAQGKGCGRYLLRYMMDIARRSVSKRILLEVRISNVIAQHIYFSVGFKELHRRKNYYSNPTGEQEDAMVLTLDLPQLPFIGMK